MSHELRAHPFMSSNRKEHGWKEAPDPHTEIYSFILTQLSSDFYGSKFLTSLSQFAIKFKAK